MNHQSPETIAIRTVNQYRRRDVIPYIGLRYYLENTAARSDNWAKDVAVNLVIHRAIPSYLKINHFKDIDERGQIGHREMFVPGPNEALSEAVLVNECAMRGGPFALSNQVFSYIPASDRDTSGIFKHYMYGLKARHDAISNACRKEPEAIVQFFDIKRFYPSISIEKASKVWIKSSEEAGLNSRFSELGTKLLFDHGTVNQNQKGKLLTGPMFSHLIGNLILGKVDDALAKAPAHYFRYVDDVVLIGTKEQVRLSADLLKNLLGELELELHDENSHKSLLISSSDWMKGELDFTDNGNKVSWMTLVGDLKRLLLWYPNSAAEMKDAFMSEGFRMPLPDYNGAIKDAGFISSSSRLIQKTWFCNKVRKITPASILNQARILRTQYDSELIKLVDELSNAKGFTARRILPKVRYRIGRLAYLATPDRLNALTDIVSTIPTLYFQSEVMRAISTGNIDNVIALGTNAAQAIAQPMRMSSEKIKLSRAPKNDAEMQSLAIIAMNGASVDVQLSSQINHELLEFANHGVSEKLMRSSDAFMRELACLHGVSNTPRHPSIFDSAFNEAEDFALDAIDQTCSSLSL